MYSFQMNQLLLSLKRLTKTEACIALNKRITCELNLIFDLFHHPQDEAIIWKKTSFCKNFIYFTKRLYSQVI